MGHPTPSAKNSTKSKSILKLLGKLNCQENGGGADNVHDRYRN